MKELQGAIKGQKLTILVAFVVAWISIWGWGHAEAAPLLQAAPASVATINASRKAPATDSGCFALEYVHDNLYLRLPCPATDMSL